MLFIVYKRKLAFHARQLIECLTKKNRLFLFPHIIIHLSFIPFLYIHYIDIDKTQFLPAVKQLLLQLFMLTNNDKIYLDMKDHVQAVTKIATNPKLPPLFADQPQTYTFPHVMQPSSSMQSKFATLNLSVFSVVQTLLC